jgi:hypothetical protein
MFNFARLSLGLLARCFRSRRRLLLENLALRQQLAVPKRRQARPSCLLTSSSGCSHEGSGLTGKRLSWWPLPKPWSAGIEVGFNCTVL